MIQDTRNLIDHYKYWETDAVKAALNKKRLPYVVAIENLNYDFNIGTVIRNANAFVAKEVWRVGFTGYDKRGTVGTHHYETILHTPHPFNLLVRYPAYRFVAVDNVEGATNIYDYKFDKHTVMLFGQEAVGLSEDSLNIADDVVYIPQWGSTRSLNVGVASGVVMYEYMRQFGDLTDIV